MRLMVRREQSRKKTTQRQKHHWSLSNINHFPLIHQFFRNLIASQNQVIFLLVHHVLWKYSSVSGTNNFKNIAGLLAENGLVIQPKPRHQLSQFQVKPINTRQLVCRLLSDLQTNPKSIPQPISFDS